MRSSCPVAVSANLTGGIGLLEHADDDQRAQQTPQRRGLAAGGHGEFRRRPRALRQLVGQPETGRHVQDLGREIAEEHRQQRGSLAAHQAPPEPVMFRD